MASKASKKSKPAAKGAKRKAVAKRAPAKVVKPRKPLPKPKDGQPVLLSGGNPQIAKGYGEAPVQAYLAAMPGWKKDIGRRLDELIVRAVPGVNKAVKWNSPFYGMGDEHWFLSFHCFTKFVKVTFLNGGSLHPKPPGESKYPYVRYLDIYEDKPFDEGQFTDWMKQASKLPGEKM